MKSIEDVLRGSPPSDLLQFHLSLTLESFYWSTYLDVIIIYLIGSTNLPFRPFT